MGCLELARSSHSHSNHHQWCPDLQQKPMTGCRSATMPAWTQCSFNPRAYSLSSFLLPMCVDVSKGPGLLYWVPLYLQLRVRTSDKDFETGAARAPQGSLLWHAPGSQIHHCQSGLQVGPRLSFPLMKGIGNWHLLRVSSCWQFGVLPCHCGSVYYDSVAVGRVAGAIAYTSISLFRALWCSRKQAWTEVPTTCSALPRPGP